MQLQLCWRNLVVVLRAGSTSKDHTGSFSQLLSGLILSVLRIGIQASAILGCREGKHQKPPKRCQRKVLSSHNMVLSVCLAPEELLRKVDCSTSRPRYCCVWTLTQDPPVCLKLLGHSKLSQRIHKPLQRSTAVETTEHALTQTMPITTNRRGSSKYG